MVFVVEVVIEEADVEVWSAVLFSVFSAHVVPDGFMRKFLAEFFHEELKVSVFEFIRDVLFVVGERERAVIRIELRFVYATHGNLPCFFESAASALSAAQEPVGAALVVRPRMEAGHAGRRFRGGCRRA